MAKKGLSGIQKFFIVTGILILVQVVIIFSFSPSQQEPDLKAIMKKAVHESGIAAEHKDLAMLQLALNAYKADNKNFPSKLDQLVPDYLEKVPLNPRTNQDFEYELVGGEYKLGNPEDTKTNDAGSGDQNPLKKDDQKRFLALLDKDIEDSTFVYDASSKKDPFRPFDFAPKRLVPKGDSPLECCDYTELKLVAVLEGIGNPKASIETPDGKGVLAEVGDTVGMYGGKIVTIEPTRITVLETVETFTGERETRTVEMFLR